MKPIAKIDVNINGIFYEKGDEIEVTSKEQLIRLNEKGYIEPLTPKEIQSWEKEPAYKKLRKGESDNESWKNTREYPKN